MRRRLQLVLLILLCAGILPAESRAVRFEFDYRDVLVEATGPFAAFAGERDVTGRFSIDADAMDLRADNDGSDRFENVIEDFSLSVDDVEFLTSADVSASVVAILQIGGDTLTQATFAFFIESSPVVADFVPEFGLFNLSVFVSPPLAPNRIPTTLPEDAQGFLVVGAIDAEGAGYSIRANDSGPRALRIVDVVPEPSAALLYATGLLGLRRACRRRLAQA